MAPSTQGKRRCDRVVAVIATRAGAAERVPTLDVIGAAKARFAAASGP
jgi:hypothetical protein